jgi:hypothetical protein
MLLLFVVAIKWVVDEFVREQINVHAAGYARSVPIGFSRFAELPPSRNKHDCFAGFRCQTSRLTIHCNQGKKEQNRAKRPLEFSAQD